MGCAAAKGENKMSPVDDGVPRLYRPSVAVGHALPPSDTSEPQSSFSITSNLGDAFHSPPKNSGEHSLVVQGEQSQRLSDLPNVSRHSVSYE